MTLINSTVSGNIARAGTSGTGGDGGGVHSGFSGSGPLTLTNSTVSGNAAFRSGGGVYNIGTATLTNSAISNNSAGIPVGGGGANSASSGGGVYNGGTLTLTNSAISGNIADGTVSGTGGGVFNFGPMTVTDSTVSGNTARDSGGLFNAGNMTLTNGTVSGNTALFLGGGGVDNRSSGTLTLNRTLVSGNTASTGPEIANTATIIANNYNLFGYNGAAGVSGFAPGITDIVPGAGVLLSYILSPLANNGGPTLTHALATGSPAINASPADANCPAADQRGVTRPQGPACDIGAFEASVPALSLTGVQSRKNHGATGDFDLPIDNAPSITGNVTVESRTIGPGHLIVFQFNAPVAATGVVTAVGSDGMPISSVIATRSGNDVLVTLTGIADSRRATISLAGVNGTGNVSASLGFLVGDVTNSRSVNAADISAVKANVGKAIDGNTYKFDLNATGSITPVDVSAVKARSGLVLPP